MPRTCSKPSASTAPRGAFRASTAPAWPAAPPPSAAASRLRPSIPPSPPLRPCPRDTRLARLTLAADGTVTARARPLVPLAEPVRLVVTPVVVDPSDRWLHHKTTRRAPYDAALAHARAVGADDGVIVNLHGRVTETSRMTLFADLGDDAPLATPPLADGVLPGILRAHLLATGAAAERPLTPDDLRRAPRLFVGNAARGMHRAVWVEGGDRVPPVHPGL